MDNIKIVSWHKQPFGDYQLGFCTVDMGGKCGFTLKVLKSKAGNIYCAFCSVRVGEEWLPAFTFPDKDYERNFLNACLEKLKQFTSQDPIIEPQQEMKQEENLFNPVAEPQIKGQQHLQPQGAFSMPQSAPPEPPQAPIPDEPQQDLPF